MSLFSIADRELRVRSEQGATYWSRCGVAAVAALIASQAILTSARGGLTASTGLSAFGTLSLALAWTVGLVIGLPWLLGISLQMTGLFILLASATLPVSTVWYLMWLTKNLFFIRWAARRLSNELRVTAPLAVGEWLK